MISTVRAEIRRILGHDPSFKYRVDTHLDLYFIMSSQSYTPGSSGKANLLQKSDNDVVIVAAYRSAITKVDNQLLNQDSSHT